MILHFCIILLKQISTLSKIFFKIFTKPALNSLDFFFFFGFALTTIEIWGDLRGWVEIQRIGRKGDLALCTLPPVQWLNSLIEFKFRPSAFSFFSIHIMQRSIKLLAASRELSTPTWKCVVHMGALCVYWANIYWMGNEMDFSLLPLLIMVSGA